jgi:hypothetical protein
MVRLEAGIARRLNVEPAGSARLQTVRKNFQRIICFFVLGRVSYLSLSLLLCQLVKAFSDPQLSAAMAGFWTDGFGRQMNKSAAT